MVNWRMFKAVLAIFMIFSSILIFYFPSVSATSPEMSNPYPPDGGSDIYPSGDVTTSVDVAWENFTDTKPVNQTHEQYPTVVGLSFDIGIASTVYYAGQTFTVGSDAANVTQILSGVSLKLKDSGHNIGDIVVEIREYNDTNGKPEDSNISCGVFDQGFLTTSLAWHYFPLPSATLKSGENYTIILKRLGGAGSLYWNSDFFGTYGGGTAIQSSNGGSTWSAFIDSQDMLFKVNSSTDWPNILNVSFSSNSSGSWVQYGRKSLIRNETVSIQNPNITDFTTYYWNVSSYNNTDILLGTNTYSFSTNCTQPPTVTINFAGNLSDKGGPYWRPPGESAPLSGVFSDGYYVNDSRQHEDWMYINCTIESDYGVHGVMLHWYNQSLSTWDNTTNLISTGNNFWEVNTSGNLTVSQGNNYSFDIWSNITMFDIQGNVSWNKTRLGGTQTRRYVQLNCSTESVEYTPLYSFAREGTYSDPEDDQAKDRLHHDQGTDGTATDHGYFRRELNGDEIELISCSSYHNIWFDESSCITPFTLDNVYFHIWYSIRDGSDYIDMGWNKSREDMYYGMDDSFREYKSDSKSNISYSTGLGSFHSDNFSLCTRLLNITDVDFTDNDIYEFRTVLIDVVGYPIILTNRSISSFIIFNVPDNDTLNVTHGDTDGDGLTDWEELYLYYTSPFLDDTDNDGTTDSWEITYGSDPNDYTTAARIPAPPNNLAITVQANLTWVIGENADRTVIVRKQDSYPVDRLDGTLIFNSTEEYFNDTGATIGNHYYYRAWSFNETYGLFSDDYADIDVIVGVPALFDIRDIDVVDSIPNTLNIYVVIENVGDIEEDMVLTWNLTTDLGAILDSGSDTFAVGGHTQILYNVEPYTTYFGYATILFEGNGASASERFETTRSSYSLPAIKQKLSLKVVVMMGDAPVLSAGVSVYRGDILVDEQLTGYDGGANFNLDSGTYIVKVSYGSFFEEKTVHMKSGDEVLLFTIEKEGEMGIMWMWFFLAVFIVAGIAIYTYQKKIKKHVRNKSISH